MGGGGVGPREERVNVRSYFESLAGELQSLTGAMNDIHDTLGGSLVSQSFFYIHSFSLFLQPPNLPPYPFALPPVGPPAQNQDPPEAFRSTRLPQRSRFPISNPNSTKRKPPSPATLTRYAHLMASSPSTTISSGKLVS
jgi:hypothetical protein